MLHSTTRLRIPTRLQGLIRLRTAFCAAAALALACLAATPSQAVLSLKYSVNGGTAVTVEDQMPGDTAFGMGSVMVAPGFTLFLARGDNEQGVPQPKDIAHILDLLVVASGDNDDRVDVWLSDVGFTTNLPHMAFESIFGGSSAMGSVTITNWLDATNTLFGEGTMIFTASIGPGAFAVQDRFEPGPLVTPYSLTTHVAITFTGSGTATVSSNLLVNVPEPATLSLFGAALMGLGVLRRRRRG